MKLNSVVTFWDSILDPLDRYALHSGILTNFQDSGINEIKPVFTFCDPYETCKTQFGIFTDSRFPMQIRLKR